MNAGSQEDFNYVRSMINLPQREVDKFALDMNKVLTKKPEQSASSASIRVKEEDIAARERMNKLKVKAAASSKESSPPPINTIISNQSSTLKGSK
jgi:hypothetical protein